MYIKIENNSIVRPPKNDLDAGMFNVDKNIDWLEAHGFEDWTDERLAEWQNSLPVTAPVIKYSKLKLITALKQRKIWTAVKSAIDEMGYSDEWQACQELSSDYTGWDTIINAFREKFPEADIDAILNDSRQ